MLSSTGALTTEAPILTAEDLAARWNVAARTVTGLARRGDLHGTQIGRQWRFTAEAVRTYEMARRPVTSPQESAPS